MSIDYSQAEQDRERIIRERQKNTAAAFERMRAHIDEQIATMNMSAVSEKVKRQQLEEIRDELQKQLSRYYSNLEDGLKSDMVAVGQSVLNDTEAFYRSLNMPISMSITSFPVEIMENVINGTVYNEKWFLSGALWGDYKDKLNDINEVIMQGIGMNLSSLEIAKQLEQFVNPSAMKPSSSIVTPCLQDPNTGKLYSMDYVKRHPEKDWSGFKETKSRFYYGKVDYNAQRLARTLVSHAYQQNIIKQAQANPFASGVKWIASGGERMCEICEERDGKVFPVDDVPMDHPNGMCTFAVETPSMQEMSDILADWVNGDPTPYDDQLNAWYEGRPIDHKITLEDTQGRRIVVDGKDITDMWKRRPDEFDFEIEDVMNAQGFDGLPRVVSAEEFDSLVKESSFIAQRTYSASDQQALDQYRDMLYNGKWYVDCSTGGAQYGQGMYCAADYNGILSDGIKEEMRHYIELNEQRGNGFSYVETFTLDKSAKIVKYNELIELKNKYAIASSKKLSELAIKGDYEGMRKVQEKAMQINNMDYGSFATMLGYDAINAEGHGESGSYTVILNRTKLIIKEPSK